MNDGTGQVFWLQFSVGTFSLCFDKLKNPDKLLQFNSSDGYESFRRITLPWAQILPLPFENIRSRNFCTESPEIIWNPCKGIWHNFVLGLRDVQTLLTSSAFAHYMTLQHTSRTGPTDKPPDYVECGCPCKKLQSMHRRGHRFSNIPWCINVYQVVKVWYLFGVLQVFNGGKSI